FLLFFFYHPASTELYSLSLHDALPILAGVLERGLALAGEKLAGPALDVGCSVGRSTFELAQRGAAPVLGVDLNFSMLQVAAGVRSEEHTSELQSQSNLVCRLLLEKKKK